MARATPNTSLIVTLLGTMVFLCGGIVVMMKYYTVQVKEAEQKDPKKKKNEPEGPYAERIKQLSPRQHAVTQGTQDDPPNSGYWDNEALGLYLDIVSDEVLFSSRDKLPSVEGRPEFSKPVDAAILTEEPEKSEDGINRTRVKSKKANTRVGWKAAGPDETLRYFLHSSAVRFVPAEDLEKEHLGAWKAQLEKQ